MNKVLNIIKFLLIIILIALNFNCIIWWWQRCVFQNILGHLIYLLFLFSLFFISIKDIIKKESISKNKTYQIITIIVLIMMNFILWRTRFDSHLFFNNKDLISEMEVYHNVLSFHSDLSSFNGGYISFLDYSLYYFSQNVIYFNVMLILLFIYRKINLNVKNKIFNN